MRFSEATESQHVTISYDRVYGAFIGQAVGDALGAPTEGMTRDEIVAKFGWVSGFVRDDPAGTDDTEYAVLTAMAVLEYGHEMTPADVTRTWRDKLLGQEGGFNRGGFSEMTAINNLRAGLSAPESGRDNHEMWSDGAAMRIAPVGVFCAGDPQEAARLAAVDAEVSHARDGIYCGQAVAAAVSVALVARGMGDGGRGGIGRRSPGLVVGAHYKGGGRHRLGGCRHSRRRRPVVPRNFYFPLPVGRCGSRGHSPGLRRFRCRSG